MPRIFARLVEIQDGIREPNENVQEFARWYISTLEMRIEGERKRVLEEIALRAQQHVE